MNYIIKMFQVVKTWHHDLQCTLSGRCAGCNIKCRQGRDCPVNNQMPAPTRLPSLVSTPVESLKRDYHVSVCLADKSRLSYQFRSITRMDAMAITIDNLRRAGLARGDKMDDQMSITIRPMAKEQHE